MAIRSAILSLQDLPDGDDVIGIDSHNSGLYRRTSRGHLLPASRTYNVYVASISDGEGRCRGMVGRSRDSATVPPLHADLLLPPGPRFRALDIRFPHLQHSSQMGTADASDFPVLHLLDVRPSDDPDHRPLRTHRDHSSSFRDTLPPARFHLSLIDTVIGAGNPETKVAGATINAKVRYKHAR